MAKTLTALVTGGSRGIGAAIVTELKRLDFSVVSPTREELDLSNLSNVEQYVSGWSHPWPSVLILNAGENHPTSLEQVTTDHWLRTMNVNLNSAFVLIRSFAPKMRELGGGKIVALSSCYSLRAREGRSPYSASKAGLNALVRSAAIEYAKDNVLVNAVAPGFVMTDLTRQNNDKTALKQLAAKVPLGRLAEPEEVARLVRFLCGPDNSYITGQLYAIDGGFLCL